MISSLEENILVDILYILIFIPSAYLKEILYYNIIHESKMRASLIVHCFTREIYAKEVKL